MNRRLRTVVFTAAGFLGAAFAGICLLGVCLPESHTATGETEIPAPPEQVFARIADPADYPRWRTDVTRVTIQGGGRWTEAGPNGTLPYRFGSRRAPDEIETIVDSTSLPFSGSWTYELRRVPAGTRVLITERGSIPSPLLRVLAPLFAPPDRTLRRYLTDLQASY